MTLPPVDIYINSALAFGALLLIVVAVLALSPNRKQWARMNSDPGGLSHGKTISTATWAVVAFVVLFETFRGTLAEWLIIGFAAIGSGARLGGKWLDARYSPPGSPPPPAPAEPPEK